MLRFIFAVDDRARIQQALEAVDSAVLLLLTGVALVVSGIIQATLYGLTVYHGLVLLALSWLTLISAFPPYFMMMLSEYLPYVLGSLPSAALGGPATRPPTHPTSEHVEATTATSPPVLDIHPLTSLPSVANQDGLSTNRLPSSPVWRPMRPESSFEEVRKDKVRILGIIAMHSLHLSFTSAFGLWLFIRIHTFDTSTPPSCTSSTVITVLGKTRPVLDIRFRQFSLVLYGLTLLPIHNLGIVFAAMTQLAIPMIALWWLVHLPVMLASNKEQWARYRRSSLLAVAAACAYGPLLFVTFVIIASVEATIANNQVAPGEAVWNLGQTLALFVAFYPLIDLAKWVYRNRGADIFRDMQHPVLISLSPSLGTIRIGPYAEWVGYGPGGYEDDSEHELEEPDPHASDDRDHSENVHPLV